MLLLYSVTSCLFLVVYFNFWGHTAELCSAGETLKPNWCPNCVSSNSLCHFVSKHLFSLTVNIFASLDL